MRRSLKRVLGNESEHCKKCSEKQKCESDERLVPFAINPFAINHGVLRDTSMCQYCKSLKQTRHDASPLRQVADGCAALCSFNRSSRLIGNFAEYFFEGFWGSYCWRQCAPSLLVQTVPASVVNWKTATSLACFKVSF
jgi:hypothetical protein